MGFFDAAFGGIASGVGGIVSSIFGNKAQRDANNANMKIAQMNNEWSERMMNKQMEYNTAQWQREAAFSKQQAADANAFTEYMQNKANEYNSASAQAARLREAGLNPALVMSGQNAGTAQGASGAQASTPSGNSIGLPSPSSAQVQPYDYSGFSRAITDAVMVTLQAQKQQAEVTNMNLNNEYLRRSMNDRVAREYEDTRSRKYDTDYRQMNESTRVALENEQYLSAVTNRLLANEQNTLVKQQIVYQDLINQNLPQKLSMDIAVLASTRDLNRHNAQSEVGKIIDTLKKKGYKLSKTMENSIFDALLYELTTTKVGSVTELLSRGFTSGRFIKGKLNE